MSWTQAPSAGGPPPDPTAMAADPNGAGAPARLPCGRPGPSITVYFLITMRAAPSITSPPVLFAHHCVIARTCLPLALRAQIE